MVEIWEPDIPGRGAWTLAGGLVNNSGGTFGYYQTSVSNQRRKHPGGQYVSGEDTSDSAYCVHLAVKDITIQLNRLLDYDLPVNGVYNPAVQDAMALWQESVGLGSSGVFGPRSAPTFYRGLIVGIGHRLNVPWRFLMGMASRESGFDPAAVGINGYDHGFVQINLAPNVHGGTVTREEALSVSYALRFAASDLRTVYDGWRGETSADPWDVAIANHNSPALAQQWGRDGVPPYVEGRIFQIADYVRDIRLRGEAF